MKKLDPNSIWIFFFSPVAWFFALLPFFFIIFMFFLFYKINITNLDFFSEEYKSEEMFSFLTIFIFVFVLFILLVICLFLWANLSYRFYKYELTEDGFKKELGVIYKKYVIIPYDRIQNVDITRGIIARIFGLSNLYIQTAGTSVSRAEGKLPGLSKKDAEEVRDNLLYKVKQSKNQGL